MRNRGARGTDVNVDGPAVGSRFPRSCRFVRLRQRSAHTRACSASFTPVFGRSVTSAAKRSVPPRAADSSTRSTNERFATSLRSEKPRFGPPADGSRTRVVNFTPSGCRCRESRTLVSSPRETARIHRRDFATPVS